MDGCGAFFLNIIGHARGCCSVCNFCSNHTSYPRSFSGRVVEVPGIVLSWWLNPCLERVPLGGCRNPQSYTCGAGGSSIWCGAGAG